MLTIYHNPRCSKSREALKLIEAAQAPVDIKAYLKEPPTAAQLRELLDKLGVHPLQIIRKQEAVFKEQFKGREFTEEEWIDILVAHPILIERPIVIKGDQAVVGRPPSNVLDLL